MGQQKHGTVMGLPCVDGAAMVRWEQTRSCGLQMQLIIYSFTLPQKEIDLMHNFEGKDWGLLNLLLIVLKRN